MPDFDTGTIAIHELVRLYKHIRPKFRRPITFLLYLCNYLAVFMYVSTPLRTFFKMLSATEDADCEFEVEEATSDKTSCEDDPWLNEIEARFEAIVSPIIEEQERIDSFNIF